jgi:hypothetical protein
MPVRTASRWWPSCTRPPLATASHSVPVARVGARRRRCPPSPRSTAGAEWMERETYDMFGIDFPGHPGLEPRILTVENFEGWPLRKDFHLASRAAKPWPGVAEPVELDEEGNKIERERAIGDAPGPYELDKAMAEQAKRVNAPPTPAVEPEAEPVEAAASQPRRQRSPPPLVPWTPQTPGRTRAGPAATRQHGPRPRPRSGASVRPRPGPPRLAPALRRQQAEGGPPPADEAAQGDAPADPAAEQADAPAEAVEAEVPPAAAAEQPEAEPVSAGEDEDVDPRVAARRKRQAEARAARAKARADKAGGAGDAIGSAGPTDAASEQGSADAAVPTAAAPSPVEPRPAEPSPVEASPAEPTAAEPGPAETRPAPTAEPAADRARRGAPGRRRPGGAGQGQGRGTAQATGRTACGQGQGACGAVRDGRGGGRVSDLDVRRGAVPRRHRAGRGHRARDQRRRRLPRPRTCRCRSVRRTRRPTACSASCSRWTASGSATRVPGHRLHAPRLREARRAPRLPPDHGAGQPPRLAVRLLQRARRRARGRAS